MPWRWTLGEGDLILTSLIAWMILLMFSPQLEALTADKETTLGGRGDQEMEQQRPGSLCFANLLLSPLLAGLPYGAVSAPSV